jgi:hypothetical protein
MTRTEGGPAPFAAESPAHDLPQPGTLAEQAQQLGQQHRHNEITPFGDAGYAYWDEGSARLLNTLGVTSPTTGENWHDRLLVVEAYCDALDPPDTGDAEPGW